MARAMSGIRVFVSFDVEHDEELFEALRAQSSSSGFAVLGHSQPLSDPDLWSETVRSQIREAGQVIFICGTHTGASASMGAELRIARQERTPYFLLWGRRESPCTKPAGARPADGMYGWTPQVLQDQVVVASRSARSGAMAETLRNKKGG
jgi:hypothetical protein